jgi:glycosyltransferase involved in cell wall biosynthesis
VARPQVTVVIPTRDRWTFLQTTLTSVLRQEEVDFEVVVVDDGSSSDAPASLRRLADRRVRIVRHPMTRGVAAARNTGIGSARGAWLGFLDDDDLWAPTKLQRQLDLASRAGASFVVAGAVRFDERLRSLEVFRPPGADRLPREILQRNAIPAGSSNVLATTESVVGAGGFDEQLAQIADWDLWIRLIHGGKAAVAVECLVAYRIHANNMAVTHPPSAVLQELDRLTAKHRSLAGRYGVSPDRVRSTRWVAGSLGREGRRLAAAKLYLSGALRYGDAGNLVRAAAALLGENLKQGGGRALGRSGAVAGRGEVPAPGECGWLADLCPLE